jgi:hypothetical protein
MVFGGELVGDGDPATSVDTRGCYGGVPIHDEESNRTSLTNREPGSEGKCATEGGTIETHSYDTANRLTDPGISYETFGNTTTLPASDANGHELTSEYYVDNQIATQKQNEETIKYVYDPAGRTMETTSENKETKAKTTAISHYPGPGGALTWTNEGSEKWSRNIPGIGGSLVAIQKSGEQPILQLRDLQGNIVATAALSETETKLLSTYNSTEFGVPQSGTTAPPYSWLGALDISSELPTSGTVTTGASSYEPEIGRPLQTEPTASPGAFPDGTGGAGIVGAPYLGADNAQLKTIAVEHEAALEAAKKQEGEERAKENECPASECGLSEGNLPTPEEGGADPCESTFLSERQDYHPIESLAFSAWVDIEWCYGGGKVLSSHVKDRGHHQGNTWMDPGYEMLFERWESKSEWDGNDWRIQQVAVFNYTPPRWVEDSLSLQVYRRFVDFEFMLEPDGQAKTSVEVHEESVP